MIKNRVKTVCLGLLLTSSSLMASSMHDYDFQTKSLVGIEGGYSKLGYEIGAKTGSVSFENVGLKLGAESRDVRIFFSGNYFLDTSSQYDYLTTYGMALQYKFNVTEAFNLYLGVNGGILNAKVKDKHETFSRTFSDPYLGGDLGVNIHLGDSVDLELGGRIMSVQANNTINGVTYTIDTIIQGYGSLIFKWQMDD